MARWTHLGLAIFWILLAIPGMLFWKEAVWFVVAMSLYANIEASFAAFLSAPPKVQKRKIPKYKSNLYFD